MVRNLSITCGLLLVAACQSHLVLMPTPEVLRDERFNVFEMNPEPLSSNELDVLYATTRVPDDGGKTFFSGAPDTKLHLGYAEVRVGDENLDLFELIRQSTTGERTEKFAWHLLEAHSLSSIERPSGFVGGKPMVPDEMRPYLSALNDYIESNAIRELTIYAHGANNTLDRLKASLLARREARDRTAARQAP